MLIYIWIIDDLNVLLLPEKALQKLHSLKCKSIIKVCDTQNAVLKLQFVVRAPVFVVSQYFTVCVCVFWHILNGFLSFPLDTAMHPVLKNLGITDKVLSVIMECVNGNKVNRRNRL